MKDKKLKVRLVNGEPGKETLSEQKIDEQGPLRSGSGSGTPSQETNSYSLHGAVSIEEYSWSYDGMIYWTAQATQRDSSIPIHEGESHYIVTFISGTLNICFTGGTKTSIDSHNHTVIEQGNSIVMVQPLNYTGSNSGIGSVTIESTYSNIPFAVNKTIIIAPGETQQSSTTYNCKVTVKFKINYTEATHQLEIDPIETKLTVNKIP